MSSRVLHHISVGDRDAPNRLLVLHGIYGAGRNWATFARGVIQRRPDWTVILVDLRLHGHSHGFEPPHTLSSCVDDLVVLTRHLGVVPTAVLGHSFGGKVALMSSLALHPGQVWVIESTPSRRSPGGTAYRMLRVLRRLPSEFEARGHAVEALEREGLAAPVAHWMATNLELTDGRYRWRFDLGDMEALLNDFFRRDLWDIVEDPLPSTRIHFVLGSESDVMRASEHARLRAMEAGRRVFAHEIRGGHWLHQDNPEDLLDVVTSGLG